MKIYAQPKKPRQARSTLNAEPVPKSRTQRRRSDDVVPTALIEHLQTTVDGFANQKSRVQWGLAWMLWNWANGSRDHRVRAGQASFASHELNKVFGTRPTFSTINLEGQYFYVSRFENFDDGQRGHTNGYSPVDHTLGQALRSFFDEPLPATVDLASIDGRKVHRLPKAIASAPRTGHRSRWKNIEIANTTPINVPALEDFARTRRNVNDNKSALAYRAARQLLILSRNPIAPGCIPIRYEESQAGRLYATSMSLQNIPRAVRLTAMKGQYDYDISNAHFSILTQLAARKGMTCDAIREYLAHKRDIRDAIASHASLSVDQVKQCLIATIYGASSNPRWSAITDIAGARAAEVLLAYPPFRDIMAEARAALTLLVGTAIHKGSVKNMLGLPFKVNEKNRTSAAAHILQGAEAAALRAIVRRYGTKISLAMHDGWCSVEDIEPKQMEDVIRTETGLDLKVEVTAM